jgi:hypothetical protein
LISAIDIAKEKSFDTKTKGWIESSRSFLIVSDAFYASIHYPKFEKSFAQFPKLWGFIFLINLLIL